MKPGELRDLAVELAQAAGQLLMRRPEELGVSTKSGPTDVVTVMDRAAEELLVARLREARPEDGLLGEEGADRDGTTGVRWVMDPLDGTVNYLYGLPHWAVSVAAEVDGMCVAGAVCAPVLGETYAAAQGEGATLNGRGLSVRSPAALATSLVATGFAYDAGLRAEQGRVVAALLPLVRDIRRSGSAALDLCQLAAGRVDAYYEKGVHRWDVAAGGVIAAEAGAEVFGLAAPRASAGVSAAASSALWPELSGRLRELGVSLDPAPSR